MSPSNVLWIDYETSSELDLKKVGADRYSRHPSTKALMLGWAVGNDQARVWDIAAGEPMPLELEPFLLHGKGTLRAHNAPFEMMITEQVMGITTDSAQWQCSQVMAFGLSFVGGLGDMMEAIGFSADSAKDKRGRRLIQIFCKRQPKNHHVQWHSAQTKPEEWKEFIEYCRQDIVAMRNLWNWCEQFRPIDEAEWLNWRIDRAINQAGIPVDMKLVDASLKAMVQEKTNLETKIRGITGLKLITQNPLRAWIVDQIFFQDLKMPNMQKATKQWTAERCLSPAKEVLEASLLVAQASSSSKWNAFYNRTDPESHLLRETLQFAGAQRTRRWAGRGVQLQNMKRSVPESDANIELILSGMPVDMYQISTSIRGAIRAPEGQDIVVSDLSSIESRLAGWLTGSKLINQTFAQGLDTYKVLASKIFNVNYEEVTKAQRTFAKPAALGCQYMLGTAGLVRYAKDYGVELSEQDAAGHVKTYREIYPELPKFWYWIKDAIFWCIRNPGQEVKAYNLIVQQTDHFLFITLPSGRRLSYFDARIEEGPAPWDELKVIEKFSFMGTNAFTTKWTRINAHAGGILENIIQAVARDVMALWIKRIHGEGGDIRMHVHDEVVLLSDKSHSEAALNIVNSIAAQPVPWAPGLQLTADGYIAERYRKD